MIILGIGGILHDAACAILRDGEIVAAAEEAKLTRGPRRATRGTLPEKAIQYCLEAAGVQADAVDCVAIARPLAAEPKSPLHLQLRSLFSTSQISLIEHHTAHAASAYYLSPFDAATILTLDGEGDFRCGSRWQAEGRRLVLDGEMYYPDSLGMLYGRVTELLGLTASADEHRVQWLSADGDDRFVPLFEEIMGTSDVWPRLDRSFFDAERVTHGGFAPKFFARLGVADTPDALEDLRPAIAAGLQRALEARVLRIVGHGTNLCIAGGLGLNALLIRALEDSGQYARIFVQPAAGNSGTALGALADTWHGSLRQEQRLKFDSLYLGPSYSVEHTKQVLENCKLPFRYLETTDEVIDAAVIQLLDRKIVAWMHGRMEFGPRALGNRSLLASPLDPYSTENLNKYIKHREASRKFATSVPAEVASEYFDVGPNARFLATVGTVRTSYRDRFSDATLAGDLIRVHTVAREDNPLYWQLLHETGRRTGLPVLYNTSFNLFGEPLVCTPRDAVRSFYSSGIDAMVVGNFLLQK